MANSLKTNPIVLDTDTNSFNTDKGVVTGKGISGGLRVRRLQLVVGGSGAATAGTVAITDPTSSIALLPTIPVGTQAANTVLVTAEFNATPLIWSDFKVIGLTATGTKLFLWE